MNLLSPSEIFVATGLPSTDVTLLDHSGAVLATSSGSLRRTGLVAGLYRVQVATGATLTEELVSLSEGESVSRYMQLLLPTVTPVKGASINHEVHAFQVQQLSVSPTGPAHGTGGRMVLFVRVVQQMNELPVVEIDGLELLDVEAAPVAPSPIHGPGFAGWSLDLSPGTYLLRTPVGIGNTTADQSVVVADGWTTYLFSTRLARSGRGWRDQVGADAHRSRCAYEEPGGRLRALRLRIRRVLRS